MQTVLQRAASWIAELRYDRIPEQALRAARLQTANMIAAAHGAAAMPEAQAVERALLAQGASGEATVVVSGRHTSAACAAAINSAYAMAQDFDDIIWMGHTCHSAVFAPMAVAQSLPHATERDYLVAVVVANEIGGRLGASSFLGPLNGQMLTHIHLVGAAAAAAKLLGLTSTQTAHALAIALAQPGFPLQPAFMQPTSKLLCASTPIQTGIQAAYLAREGVTGALQILEDSRGFWSRFAYVPLPQMWEDLGQFWAIQTLTIKSYPGCHYFQTACQGIEELLARHPGKSARDVQSLTIDTTKLALEVTRFGGHYGGDHALTPVNVCFDLKTAAAVFLHAGRLTTQEIDSAWLAAHEPRISALSQRIQVRHAPRLTAQTLGSGRAIPSGRAALATLGPRNLLRLRKRYAAEYRSELMSFGEALGWLVLAFKRVWRGTAPAVQAKDSTIPLYFPSRVTVRWSDGSSDLVEHALPAGSLASPAVDEVIATKFLREVGRTLGVERARAQLSQTLSLGQAQTFFTRLPSSMSSTLGL